MAKVCPNCELTYSDDDFFCAADGSPLRSTAAEADNLVGTVIADRYRVESILGEGGMGRVYRAKHVRVPRDAAIKVLRRTMVSDAYAVAAFNREARNAASVGDHPNVASVYDFGETPDGLVFLAMEFVEGETLGKRLERESMLPPARAIDIVRQIAAGLSAAHDLPEPVVHRDLKPDNILLKTTRDGSDWVKIVDFGIAKAAKRDTQLLTSPGLVVGTPRYMSPEQLTGGTIDVRSDIYALGMMAFQMLSGRMPFRSTSRDEESTIQWALQRLAVSPLSLRQVAPDTPWPESAEQAVARALAANPDDRYPTAMEFARSLARAFGFVTPMREISVVDGTAGPIAAALDSAARSTAPTALVGTPTVAPVPAHVLSPAASVRARPSAARAETPAPAASAVTSGRGVGRWITAAVVVVALGAGALWQRSRNAATPESTGRAQAPTAPLASDKTPPAADSVRPRADSHVAVAVDSGRLKKPADSKPKPAASAPTVVTNPERKVVIDPKPAAQGARSTLDQMKSVLSDLDAAAASGGAAKVARDVTQLLPTLTTRADSVEATYYGIEASLVLDRTDDACRLLTRIRGSARGTEYEGRVERFLADPDLACAGRR